jgi:hypothetical protein
LTGRFDAGPFSIVQGTWLDGKKSFDIDRHITI